MSTLLLTLLLGGTLNADAPKSPMVLEKRGAPCEKPSAPVILVANGSSDWPAKAADRIVGELKRKLGRCCAIEVARFDAGPTLQLGFSVRGSNRDLVLVKPRTPMREAMETSFFRLMTAPSPRTMVVIAYGQSYPTALSSDRLLALARRSQTTVHAIHLAQSGDRGRVLRRLGRSLRRALSSLAVAFGQIETGHSARDTARLLRLLADATGGITCTAADEPTETVCASLVAEILGNPR